MRKLTTPDIFRACRIVEKSGIKDKLVPIIKRISTEGVEAIDAGIMGILTVVLAMADESVERAIYELLAPVFEISVDELIALPLDEVSEYVIRLENENDLHVFFSALSGLLRRK